MDEKDIYKWELSMEKTDSMDEPLKDFIQKLLDNGVCYSDINFSPSEFTMTGSIGPEGFQLKVSKIIVVYRADDIIYPF